VDEIYAILTQGKMESGGQAAGGLAQILPIATVTGMAGLIEALAAPPYNNEADLAELGRSLSFEVDDLFPVADALNILRFADLREGRIQLTADSARFAQLDGLDGDERKAMFAQHLLHHVPLAAHIVSVLSKRADHQAPRTRFEDELEDHVSHEVAEATLPRPATIPLGLPPNDINFTVETHVKLSR
jgi:NitT/TauT family transport system ATP-binding protein